MIYNNLILFAIIYLNNLNTKIPIKFKLYRTDISYKFQYNLKKKHINYLLISNLNYIKYNDIEIINNLLK